MTKKTGIVAAALIAALPLAAAMPDGEPIERVVVRTVEGGDAEASAEGTAKHEVKIVVVGGEGDEARVLEDVLVDAPHRRVLRVEGAPGEAGERFRMLLGGPEGRGFFGAIEGRGFLGVHLVELTPELRSHFGAAGEAGLLVGRVEAGSPAEQAGLRVGDLLTRVGGEPVSGNWDVLRQVRPLTAGQGVALEVVRDGRVETVSATVTERELPRLEAGALMRRLGEEGESFTWELDPEELSKRMEKVTEYFSSPEWKAHVRELESTSRTLEERLAGLEEELRALEQKLQEDEPEE
jgi:membrane-associated protease RseP (regulator of RpoE activity)